MGRKAGPPPGAEISPYHAPAFIPDAIAKGNHRAIIGGRWDETGIIQMRVLLAEGLRPKHRLLDIGCGPLRSGCRIVGDRARLPKAQLVGDADFAFPGVPDHFDYLFCFAVFTHLPMNHLRRALLQIARRFTRFEKFIFTVFLAPDAQAALGPVRQPDGVVTHDIRPP
ncbi:MAG: class I SAM-dependent methyltransferase, partial [Gemmobacter sp.]